MILYCAGFCKISNKYLICSNSSLNSSKILSFSKPVKSYIKAQTLSDYQAQRCGGKGKAATKMKDEDFVDQLFVANSHDTVLCFSSTGKVHWLKVYELPMASRIARGKPIVNLLPLEKEESINAILPVSEFSNDQFVFMVTSSGTCKKTSLTNFARPRKGGILNLHRL
jgi:DNA gyrase subunit A